MPTVSNYPRRKPLRLADFDYHTPGAYFVTVVTDRRPPRFGIVDGRGDMVLNELGRAVAEEWLALGTVFPTAALGEFVVMPNHFHAVLWILEPDPTLDRPSLSDTMGRFKSRTTRAHLRLASTRGERAPRLWQCGYHDRVLRDERELEAATDYIAANPTNWREDKWYFAPQGET